MARYHASGVTCRLPTVEERQADHAAAMKQRADRDTIYVGGVQTLEVRLQQVKAVKAHASENKITIAESCEFVGISFSNYRKALSTAKKKNINIT